MDKVPQGLTNVNYTQQKIVTAYTEFTYIEAKNFLNNTIFFWNIKATLKIYRYI